MNPISKIIQMSRNINFTGIQKHMNPHKQWWSGKDNCEFKDSDVSGNHLHLPPTLDTSFTYRPMSNRGTNGVLNIGGLVLGRSISADYQPMSVWTLVNNWLMSDRYVPMYDRCNWHRPDCPNMLPESPSLNNHGCLARN